MTDGLVTVFGGTGFLGHRVVEQLTASGRPVRIAARRPERAPWSGEPSIELQQVDIRDPAQVQWALAGCDAAVNAVSLYAERPEARFRDVHVAGARAVAESAVREGVRRLIHVSGIGADPHSPSAYVAARGEGELAVRDALPAAVLLRPSVLYGPDGGLLRTLDGLTRLPFIPLFGDGHTRLQPAHADDVATACVRAILQPDTDGRTYELGGPEVFPYRELLSLVLRHRARRRPLVPVAFPVWRVLARILALLPNPPVTEDQVILMARDNTVGEGMPSFADLNVTARPLTAALAACLP